MLLIEHRVNTLAHLARVPPDRGIEIDIRDYGGDLVLAHEPLQSGESVANLLAACRHPLVIFNVKCDGLEGRLSSLAERYHLRDYFFLDLASPSLVTLVRGGERRVAVRFSEFEPVESALAFAGLANWVWIDCFTRLPLTPETYAQLRPHFRLCLVSPELQRYPRQRIAEFRSQLQAMPVDAVCSDYCDDWL